MDEGPVLTGKGVSQAKELGAWLKAASEMDCGRFRMTGALPTVLICYGPSKRTPEPWKSHSQRGKQAQANPVSAVFVSPLLRARQTLEVARTMAGALRARLCNLIRLNQFNQPVSTNVFYMWQWPNIGFVIGEGLFATGSATESSCLATDSATDLCEDFNTLHRGSRQSCVREGRRQRCVTRGVDRDKRRFGPLPYTHVY